jgi:hypothetical protein
MDYSCSLDVKKNVTVLGEALPKPKMNFSENDRREFAEKIIDTPGHSERVLSVDEKMNFPTNSTGRSPENIINSFGGGSVEAKNEFFGMKCRKNIDNTLVKPTFIRSSNFPTNLFGCSPENSPFLSENINSFGECSTKTKNDFFGIECRKITDIDFFEKSYDDFETDNQEFNEFNEEYFLFLEKIRDEIEKMDKIHHIKILKILKNYKNIKLNENKSGVFINLSFLPKYVVNKILNYVEYIREQEKYILTVENQQENLKNLLSGNNPIRSCENIHSQTI